MRGTRGCRTFWNDFAFYFTALITWGLAPMPLRIKTQNRGRFEVHRIFSEKEEIR